MKRHFGNPWPHESHGVWDILRWKFRRGLLEAPEIPDAPDEPAGFKRVSAVQMSALPESGWRVTWLGHASFLLQGAGVSLLVDPVFSEHCAPLPFPSMRRKVSPPCRIDEFPEIHAVLLTHSHYDHLDLPTLRRLGMDLPLVVAEGHAEWLGRKGFSQVREVPWHSSLEIVPGITVTATPAQHFTSRTPFDRDLGHWCGWLVEGAGCKLWHAGDSGFCPAFQEVGSRYGPIDFGMIPIGAYLPRQIMKAMHMNPEEAVQAFLETRCLRAAAMHWGTFRLTDEPMQEPVMLLARALEKKNLPADSFAAGRVGDQWDVAPGVI